MIGLYPNSFKFQMRSLAHAALKCNVRKAQHGNYGIIFLDDIAF